MADQKNKGQEKKIKEEPDNRDQDDEQPSGYGSSGGNMGQGSLVRKGWEARSPPTIRAWEARSPEAPAHNNKLKTPQ